MGQEGSPERLEGVLVRGWRSTGREGRWRTYLMLVTSQSLATAALQIRLPRKPLPPQTTNLFLAAVVDMVYALLLDGVYVMWSH